MLAELHRKTGDHPREVAVLEDGLERFGERAALLRALAWARRRTGNFDGAMEAATRLRALGITARQRSEAAVLAANLHIADNRIQGALARLREAYSEDPGNTALVHRIYGLAKKHNDRNRALEALRILVRREPENTRLRSELEALEKATAP
jgi:tetratricopeptide (TPR) repeat protein